MEGLPDGGGGAVDLQLALLLGDAMGVDAVGVEGVGVVVDVGDFGEAEAEVVVDRGGEAGINATGGIVGSAADEAEMEGHEVGEQALRGVGDLAALAGADADALGVDDLVVGVDHADLGVLVSGFWSWRGRVSARAVGRRRSSLSTQPM